MSQQSSSGQPGYEASDAQPGKILMVGGILAVATLGTVLVSGWIDGALSASEPESDRHPLAPEGQVLPPEPRLQVRPVGELEEHHAAEEAALARLGWVDAQGGIVQVPVEVAIDAMLEEGFPTREGGDR